MRQLGLPLEIKDEVKAPFARCYGCALQPQPSVPGSGCRDHPDIAFVAEAPGETEVEQGIPLVGKSGSLLRKMITDLGIDENRCYFTNACLCRPENNKTPNAAMALACFSRLVAELVEVKPKLIVSLGAISSKELARYATGGITKHHGIYQEITLRSKAGGKWTVGVVPTYHPAYILRSPDVFPDVEDELLYAKSIVDGQAATVSPPYKNYKFVTTQHEFDEFLEEFRGVPMAACDVETDGLEYTTAQMLCIGFSWNKEQATVIDWALLNQNLKNTRALNSALEGVQLALHNGVYDIPFLWYHGLTNAQYYIDTMVLHYLLDERQGTHGLEKLAIKYYHAPPYKAEFRKSLDIRGLDEKSGFSERIHQASKENLFRYNGADCDYTYRLAVDLMALVMEDGQLDVFKNIEMPAARIFTEFYMNGILVDRTYMNKMGRAWTKEENELIVKMKEAVGDPEFNPNSTKQLSAYLYDVLKLKSFSSVLDGKGTIAMSAISEAITSVKNDPEAFEYWTARRAAVNSGAKGALGVIEGVHTRSTSTYVLYWLRQQHEFPNMVIRWRFLRKRRSMYYTALSKYVGLDSRIHPKYNLVATKTGRKSTEDPTIHNLPRGDEIYNIFVARPGWAWIHADYSQAEMRMMAYYSNDQNLIHVLNTSDMHSVTAMAMFHISEKKWATLSKTEVSNKRIAAKMLTFGIPYGRSIKGLAPQLGVTLEEAQEYIDAFYRPYPLLKQWIDKQRQKGIDEQIITSIFGRRRRFPFIPERFYGYEVGRMAGNMAIQSAINDLTMLAMINSVKMLRLKGIPVEPGAHIHDSVNFSVPIPLWLPAVKIILRAMSDIPFETDVLFPCELEVGNRWGSLYTVYKRGNWVKLDEEDKTVPDWIRRVVPPPKDI